MTAIGPAATAAMTTRNFFTKKTHVKTGENEANTHETRQRGPGIGTSCRSRTSTVENLDGTHQPDPQISPG